MERFVGSLKTMWPVYLTVTLCLAGMGIAGWLISVLVAIQHHTTLQGGAKVGGIGKRNVKLGMSLLAINICITVICVAVLTWWKKELLMRDMCVKAELIKQKEATEEAERKSMSKSVAVANASHEVRTALAGITGLIQMCRADADASAAHSALNDNLKHMESCTNDLYSLLNSILDASKIEAGKMQIEEDEFDLQELLEDVVDLYYPLGIKKGVDVILDQCDESVEKFRRVRGDRGKLKQVLCNLLFNAIKFTDEGYVALRVWARKPSPLPPPPTPSLAKARRASSSSSSPIITILKGCVPFSNLFSTGGGEEKEEEEEVNDNSEVLQRKDGEMEYIFKVVDTGKGIPKEKRNTVFENYAQVKETGGYQLGHGLGLGIALSLVRLMGGEIGIEDKENGERGTCFKFNIFLDNIITNNNSNVGYSSSSSSHAVVFMHCEERGKIIRRFLESRGVKVSVIHKGHKQLSRKLKKIKREAFLPRSSSSSSSRSREELENEDDTMPLHTKTTSMVLIIIDTSAALFSELIQAVSKFHKDLQPGCSRVLWIDTALGAHNLDKDFHLPSTDLLVSKPLQGSRLHNILGLLPDFASSSQQGEIQVVIDKEKEEKDEVESAGGSEKKALALAGKRILVVDDNSMLRKICSTVVSHLGALAFTANNGEEALQLVSKALQDHPHQPPFDYILMDCEMPIMDGFEATKRIKEEGKAMGIWIPIIALTAHTGKEEMEKVTEAGMDYYMPKPINAATLLAAIQVLDKSTHLL